MKTQRRRREKRKQRSWLKGAEPESPRLEVFFWKEEKIRLKKKKNEDSPPPRWAGPPPKAAWHALWWRHPSIPKADVFTRCTADLLPEVGANVLLQHAAERRPQVMEPPVKGVDAVAQGVAAKRTHLQKTETLLHPDTSQSLAATARAMSSSPRQAWDAPPKTRTRSGPRVPRPRSRRWRSGRGREAKEGP